MTPSKGNPRSPPDQTAPQPPSVAEPEAGKKARVEDKRAEFERISRETPRDREAERAFIEGKIEMVRTDPNLSDEEKKRAIEDLLSQLPEP